VKDAHVYIQDLICQDGNQTTKTFSRTYCKLIQVIILVDAKEHFALAFKVELYMALLQNSLNEETKRLFLSNFQDWSNDVSIKELPIVDEVANMDRLHLLSTLRAQVGSSNQIENLIRRLQTMSHDFLAVENTAHVKDMWREEQKNLQRLEPSAHQG
jgi:hypothetical protein